LTKIDPKTIDNLKKLCMWGCTSPFMALSTLSRQRYFSGKHSRKISWSRDLKSTPIPGGATTPAANHLVSVDQKVQNSMRRMQKRFTSMWPSLYLCKRACPNIQTAVAFLTTRVKKPDEDCQRSCEE